VLVGGGKEILSDLSAALGSCKFVYLETAAQILSHARQSSVLIVDERLQGALDLCRRLRSDPITAAIPIVLRSQRALQVPRNVADASVLLDDINGLVHVIQQMIPAGPAVPAERSVDEMWELGAEDIFDDAEATVLWRRPEEEEAAQGWPPPPPVFAKDQDKVEFALTFSGYMNSLTEALENPSKLSGDERKRLRAMSHTTLDAAERCINQVQGWVNESLMAKDLTQMKVLTSAKNSLYDKLQKMRQLVAQMRQEQSSDSLTPVEQAVGLQRRQSSRKKSQITLAAEAKEAAQRLARVEQTRTQRKRPPPTGPTARKEGRRLAGPTWLWIGIAVVSVGGSAAWVAASFMRREPGTLNVPDQNTRPSMKRIDLDQTPGGIFARPLAVDAEHDRITFTFRWFINGQLVDGPRTARLPNDRYELGNSVEVVILPRDSGGEGSPMRSRALVIGASKPRRARRP